MIEYAKYITQPSRAGLFLYNIKYIINNTVCDKKSTGAITIGPTHAAINCNLIQALIGTSILTLT